MGARNAIAAYHRWAGRVPATSLQVLVYMALVSKDSDDAPWFSQGREALSRFALGRAGEFGRADARAVERAVHPLLVLGAISTVRRASVRRESDSTAVYRLNLSPGTDAPRNPVGVSSPHAPRNPVGVEPSDDDSRPTETVTHAPRIPSSRPTDSVLTPHGNRGPEETVGDIEEREEEEIQALTTTSHPPHASAAEPPNVIPISDHRKRVREEGRAEIAAKGAALRDRLAARDAHRSAKEAT